MRAERGIAIAGTAQMCLGNRGRSANSSTRPACISMSSRPRCCPSSSNVARADSSQLPRRLGSIAERFEHRPRMVHVGLDQWCPRRDPEDADQVEAHPLARCTGDGPQSCASGARAKTLLLRRRLPTLRAAASARSSAPSHAPTWPSDTRASASTSSASARAPRLIVGAQHRCRSPRAVGDRAERLGGSQRRQPGVEHVGDRRFVLCFRRLNEVGDNNRGFIGLATGDQRVAAFTQERTPAKVFGGQQREGSTKQRRRARHVVAVERPVRRRRQVRCRSFGQTTRPVAVALPELDSELVRLLQVISQRFVVLGSRRAHVGDQPLGVALVQIGAHLLEDSPIRRVTDERMVEAEHPVVGPPRPLRIDQLAAAQRVEMHFEIGTDLGDTSSSSAPRAKCRPMIDAVSSTERSAAGAARCGPRAPRGSSVAARFRRRRPWLPTRRRPAAARRRRRAGAAAREGTEDFLRWRRGPREHPGRDRVGREQVECHALRGVHVERAEEDDEIGWAPDLDKRRASLTKLGPSKRG